MHLTPHMYKFVTLKGNAKENHEFKMLFHTKYVQNCYFEGQMLRKSLIQNAFDAKYVQNCYFEGKC